MYTFATFYLMSDNLLLVVLMAESDDFLGGASVVTGSTVCVSLSLLLVPKLSQVSDDDRYCIIQVIVVEFFSVQFFPTTSQLSSTFITVSKACSY